mgnify:CR=1 FL=1
MSTFKQVFQNANDVVIVGFEAMERAAAVEAIKEAVIAAAYLAIRDEAVEAMFD